MLEGYGCFAAALVGGAALLGLAVWLYIWKQGDARFEFLVAERSRFKLIGLKKESAAFLTSIPFVNSGAQDGTIVDLFPRHLLPEEQFDQVKAESFLARADVDRSDGYWEALIVPKKTGGVINLIIILSVKDGDIVKVLQNMVDMPVKLIAHIVARSEWYLQKSELILRKEEVEQELLKAASGEEN